MSNDPTQQAAEERWDSVKAGDIADDNLTAIERIARDWRNW